MNGKTCRRLRREAREETIGMRARRLIRGPNGNAINDLESTRGVYRNKKRAAR